MILYVITNRNNGKRYVGVTVRPLHLRWSAHVSQSKKPKTAINRAIAKHGIGAFTIEHVASARSLADLLELERIVIAQEETFAASDRGYNLTLGGEGTFGFQPSQDTRAKIAAKLTGNVNGVGKRLSADAIERRSAKRRGKSHGQAAIDRMRSAATGRKLSAETKEKIGIAFRGKALPLEHRAKLSAAKKGKPKSLEHREKLRAARLAVISRAAQSVKEMA